MNRAGQETERRHCACGSERQSAGIVRADLRDRAQASGMRIWETEHRHCACGSGETGEV
ncbi:MAG: hypothetical protein LUI87_05275 [Lachnospiraceae bacterium]|nr:hypothetical protein [Lachnospiraceae bacterium]